MNIKEYLNDKLTHRVYFSYPLRLRGSEKIKRYKDFIKSHGCEIIDPFENEGEWEAEEEWDRIFNGFCIWKENLRLISVVSDMVVSFLPDRNVFGAVAEIEYAFNEHKDLLIITNLEHPYLDYLRFRDVPIITEKRMDEFVYEQEE